VQKQELTLDEEMALIPDSKAETTEDKNSRLRSEEQMLFGTPGRISEKQTPVNPKPEAELRKQEVYAPQPEIVVPQPEIVVAKPEVMMMQTEPVVIRAEPVVMRAEPVWEEVVMKKEVVAVKEEQPIVVKTPTPVQKVVAEIKFDEQKSAFMKKSPIQPSFRHEMKPMTFEQQS
jgi:hypothetical protein